MNLSQRASDRQDALTVTAEQTGRRAVRVWRRVDPGRLDAGWDAVAPELVAVVTAGQVTAARQASRFVNPAGRQKASLVAEAFGGATRDGRSLAAELFAAVTTTKTLIGRGVGVPAAFRAGAGFMSVMAATLVADAGRAADKTLGVGRGLTHYVRVVQPGACSRCAILAGVVGYREAFERHPRCKCTSMMLPEGAVPAGFFRDTGDYFESLSVAEQDRVFTKAGAEAIRLGADPVRVVNARRGALRAKKYPDGTFAPARLHPVTIGRKADGSPLQVYATREGTSARSVWGRSQSLDVRRVSDRYRRTSTLRLMPEQIMSMAATPERARELLARYGYLNLPA